MSTEFVPSDVALLDLLRKHDQLTVNQLSSLMEVTATAVRQRLSRLRAQGLISRAVEKGGRGRPVHRYTLTESGRKKTGANFADLAIALWEEIRSIRDPDVRRGLLERISRRLAAEYDMKIEGGTLEERMSSLAELFGERDVPIEVRAGDLPVLTVVACPYPRLAEIDRSVCAMERILFSELLGEEIRLSQCRLDGDGCCTFEPSGRRQAEGDETDSRRLLIDHQRK